MLLRPVWRKCNGGSLRPPRWQAASLARRPPAPTATPTRPSSRLALALPRIPSIGRYKYYQGKRLVRLPLLATVCFFLT